ncbi:MAG: GNAT family N-acetyltransferase [Cyclobacteriaceae bacterium]|nr:GNAT family N-acetyltransferase [Cyclobacteriaceae bacterium]UYN85586.1 MAG: GNAT family N-acetyltransferase [Cyclobacteriaceae bacterium]
MTRIAQCHRKAFPKALSTAMGQAYVEKMLEWYLVDGRAFIFFIEEAGTCVGYCGGLKYDGVPVGSASSMIQHSYHAAVAAMVRKPWLFFHPEFLKKYKLAIKNVWRRWVKPSGSISSSKSCNPPHTGLIVIGVDPAFQGKGYGRIMLTEFERLSAEFGYHHLMLTVRSNNAQAISAYKKSGWSVTSSDKKSTTMEKITINKISGAIS